MATIALVNLRFALGVALHVVNMQNIVPYSTPKRLHKVWQTGYVNYQIESQSENLTHIINQMGMNGMCTI